MPRTQRRQSETGWYHVMNRGVDRQSVFFDDADRVDFGRLLGVASDATETDVSAYCLMGNHFHLLVRAEYERLSAFMHALCTPFVRHLNDRIGRDGPLFKGRFHSVPVESDAHLLMAHRYIHRNPLGLPGVERSDHYRWSSQRTYLGLRRRPAWLSLDALADYFDGDVARYQRFVDDPCELDLDLDTTTVDVISLIALVAAEHCCDDRTERRLTTTVATLLLDDPSASIRSAVRQIVEGREPGAIRTARSRARRHLATDPVVAKILASVRDIIA